MSAQDKVSDTRVQITAPVYKGDAQKKVELPFVMAVMTDLSGSRDPDAPLPPVVERKLIPIDAHTLDDRMKAIEPQARFRVANKITGEGELAINLKFEKMDDFSPTRIAEQVDGLKELYATRKKLSELLAMIDGKTNPQAIIAEALQKITEGTKPNSDESEPKDKETVVDDKEDA